MPAFGTLDIAPRAKDAPRIDNFDAEAWTAEGVEILQLMYEIDDTAMASMLPAALHPTIPPTLMLSVTRYPDSPFGPFTMALTRIGCRAATRPRGFSLRAYIDTQAACDAMASRWGYAARVAEVRLSRYHDRISASVTDDAREVLRMALVDPEPISAGDIQYVSNMNLCRVASEDDRLVLLQVDPEYRFHRAERGRPQLDVFDAAAWDAGSVEPVYPVHASFTQSDTGMPKVRWALDPNTPAMAGTRAVS